jgi:hypothetical protein
MANMSGGEQNRIVWRKLDRTCGDVTLPCLDFDVDFTWKDGYLTIARLNEFGRTLEIRAEDAALVPLLDGKTTAREAQYAVYGLPGDVAGLQSIGRLAEQVVQEGFVFLLGPRA